MVSDPIDNQRGFAPMLLVVIVVLLLIAAGLGYRYLSPSISKNSQITTTPLLSPEPSSTIEVTATLSPSITATPTAKPSVATTPKPSVVATPKPKSNATNATQTLNTTAPENGLATISVVTPRGTFRTTVIVMNSPKMVTDTGNDSNCGTDCTVMPLADYATRNGAFAAVNGSYFCPDTYADCASKKNSFDFPVYNSGLGKWINEDKLFWNDRALFYQNGSTFGFVKNAKDFSGGITAGITNYPALLDKGNVVVGDYSLSANQQAKGTKVGLGLNGSRVWIAVSQGVDVYDFAEVFKSLGAQYALNLDTGGSTALWHGGRYVFGPGRNLPNAVMFK